MTHVFEVIDNSKRKIHLSKERWKHISTEHPELSNYLEEIKNTLAKPDKLTTYELDEKVKYYYTYHKNRKSPAKFLLVIVNI